MADQSTSQPTSERMDTGGAQTDAVTATVASPSSSNAAAASSSSAVATAVAASSVPSSTPSASPPVGVVPEAAPLHDQLDNTFSGDALQQLQQLGVSAFDSFEIERNVLAEAMAADEQKQAEKEAKRAEAAASSSAKPSSSSTAPARKRIPKKSPAKLEAEQGRLPAPAPRPREVVIHPVERKPPPASRQFRAGGVGGGKTGGSSSSRGASIIERATSQNVANLSEKEAEAYAERQKLIETGEITPFASMGSNLAKGFQRVQTHRIGAAASANSAAAAASPAQRAPSAAPKPVAKSKPALKRKNLARSSPLPSPSPSPSPSPTPRSSTSSAKRPKPNKRRKRSSDEDDELDSIEEEEEGSDGGRRRRGKTTAKKEYHPWQCERCTFLNSTDFTSRCEMCHWVRPRDAAASTIKTEPGVKSEPGTEGQGASKPKSKYIEISDSEEEEGAESELYPIKQEEKEKKKKRKRSSDAEEEEEEWVADQEAEEEDEDDTLDDPVDHALKEEDELTAAEDISAEEHELEEEADYSSRSSRRRRVLHDDYEDWRYEDRVEAWRAHREEELRLQSEQGVADGESHLDVAFDGGFILPAFVWNRLFAYQKTCIKWLWELHAQHVGGIIADEMGLGKTIQVIAFLAGLHYSAQHSALDSSSSAASSSSPFRSLGPSLLIVPATLLSQWLREFHEWYPELRVIVLHDSVPHHTLGGAGGKATTKKRLVQKAFEHAATQGAGSVLITTYQSIHSLKHLLLPREWNYVVLDEGHKIKSPDAGITLLCKQFLSVHRLILTGSPIQNNLTEMWSLFDFIFPGKLGTLPVFEEEFVWPILQGGYTSAKPVQIQLAYKCALILRDMINPYILRRSKADVAQHLPPKTEQVLFCNLTPHQHEIYRRFIEAHATEIGEVMAGHTSLFRVIHYLRKICNHPDLLKLKVVGSGAGANAKGKKGGKGRGNNSQFGRDRSGDRLEGLSPLPGEGSDEVTDENSADYGSVERSGKMQVLQAVLRMWHAQGHRCLLFSQTRQMLDILEKFISSEGYTYRRVDGSTSIRQRLPLIDEFNRDSSVFIMLLTTRAGGLGLNLTGADRVVLYDPDWNPASDAQARERAYRIGQTKSVTVYRLITRGCIEEKVYHRQIFKQFLTDKVLRDPKQKRFFSNQDIKDLFSLAPLPGTTGGRKGGGGVSKGGSHHAPSSSSSSSTMNETAHIFKETGGEIRPDEVLRLEEERRRQQAMKQEEGGMKKEELEEGEVEQDVAMDTSESKSLSSSSPPAPRRLQPVPIKLKKESGSDSDELPFETAIYDPDAGGAPSSSPTHDDSAHAQSSADDNRILAALFSQHGLQSAMDHDVILSSSSNEEKKVLTNLAAKVAQRAVEALKKSRRDMRDQPVNAPTWTGKSGVSGAPGTGAAGASLSSLSLSASPSPPPSSSSGPKPRFGTTSRRPLLTGSATAPAINPLEEVIQEGKLRAPTFNEPAGFKPVAAAASSSSEAGVRHFDSSVSGFSLTSTTGPAPLATRALGTGGASSSSTLLARMRNRNMVSSAHAAHTGLSDDAVTEMAMGTSGAAAGSARVSSSSSSAVPPDRSTLLLSSLRSTLAAHPEGVSSNDLIAQFATQIGNSEADKLVFRQMLRSVAVLVGKKKQAKWVLKEEFE